MNTKKGEYNKTSKPRFRIKLFGKPAQTLRFGERVWMQSGAYSLSFHTARRTQRRCDWCERIIEEGEPYMKTRHLRIPEWNNQMGTFRTCATCISQKRWGSEAIDELSIVQ